MNKDLTIWQTIFRAGISIIIGGGVLFLVIGFFATTSENSTPNTTETSTTLEKPEAPAPAPSVAIEEEELIEESGCNPNYSGCLSNGGDLDCPDIGHSVQVIGSDVYRLDRDRDGVGCE